MDDTTKRATGEPSLAETLGARAGRLVKNAKPRVQKAAAEVRPKLEQAARDALDYAREHEEELREVATKVAKSRVPVILRPAVDAVANAASPSPATPPPAAEATARPPLRRCPACSHDNPPSSRFCNQCGATLA